MCFTNRFWWPVVCCSLCVYLLFDVLHYYIYAYIQHSMSSIIFFYKSPIIKFRVRLPLLVAKLILLISVLSSPCIYSLQNFYIFASLLPIIYLHNFMCFPKDIPSKILTYVSYLWNILTLRTNWYSSFASYIYLLNLRLPLCQFWSQFPSNNLAIFPSAALFLLLKNILRTFSIGLESHCLLRKS